MSKCISCYHPQHSKPCRKMVQDGFSGEDPCGCSKGVSSSYFARLERKAAAKEIRRLVHAVRYKLSEIEACAESLDAIDKFHLDKGDL